MKKTYQVIGLMSGTSLDGLDIAYCEFRLNNSKWSFDILEAETIKYTQVWLQILQDAPALDGVGLALLNTSYGHWTGQTVNQFNNKHKIHPRLIASHGHTIFHRPQEKMTLQIGSGAAIAAETGITTVSDFRALNIALGGQGAPLVPVGDELLFGDYGACINIGGFANISIPSPKGRVAFDICPANIILNYLSNKIGLPFDPSGSIAASGKINEELLDSFNNLLYYKQPAPKSLGKEWVEHNVMPLLEPSKLDPRDLLCTFTHHIAAQISINLPQASASKALFTGGGSHNSYLINLLKEKSVCHITEPPSKVIDFKEALIFGLLGVLRFEGMTNCYASATGARVDCSSGALHLPPKRNLI